MNELETGQTVNATMPGAMPYGAFSRLADRVEGLIHVSGVPGEQVAHPTAIDRDRWRLSLSARLAERT